MMAAINASDSARPRCLSSSVPCEPNKCGGRGYLMKSSRVAPITHEIAITFATGGFRRCKKASCGERMLIACQLRLSTSTTVLFSSRS